MVQINNANMFGYVFLFVIGMYVLYYFYVYYCIAKPTVPITPVPSEYETEIQRRVQAEVEKIMAQSEGCIEQCITRSKAKTQAGLSATKQKPLQQKKNPSKG